MTVDPIEQFRAELKGAWVKDQTVVLNQFVDHLRTEGFSVFKRLHPDGDPGHERPDLDKSIASFLTKKTYGDAP